MLDVEWKATIKAKLDSLVARMAKVEPMVDSISEIKAMFQQKQCFKHRKLLPHEPMYTTTPPSTTQMHHPPFEPNILKEVAYTLVPPLAKFSSTPSCLKFIPTHDLGVEAKQRSVGVNTTFVELLDVTVGTAIKGGKVDGSEKIGGDEIENDLGQM
jgi:hypothetical protein